MISEKTSIVLVEIIICLLIIIVISSLCIGILFSTKKPPDRIQNFCLAQYEIYNKPFDECIDMYKNRAQ